MNSATDTLYSKPVPRLRLAFVADAGRPTTRPVRHPQNVARFVRELIDPEHDECSESFWSIHVDARNRIVGVVCHSRGGWSASVVRPREVFCAALLAGASSIILAHNHPSGDPAPSREDIQITRQLIEAGTMLGVRVLDHVIIGTGPQDEGAYASLRERGLL